MKFDREYGVAGTITFAVRSPDLKELVQPVFAAGDVLISVDEGLEANTTNLPVQVGQHFYLVLTAAELTGKRITIRIEDQDATKAFVDEVFVIETYGSASAQNSFVDAKVSSRAAPGDAMALTAAAEASASDAVWDEARSGHVAAGSFGEVVDAKISSRAVPGDAMSLTAASEAAAVDAVWDEARAGHVAAGSFGEVVDAKVSSRAAPGDSMALTAAERTTLSNTLMDLANGVEDGMTPRQAMRLLTAILGGLVSGAGTGTEVFKAAVSASKERVTATVDSKGNRTGISVDLS